MERFVQEISNFKKYGTYEYVFDEGGNLVFESNPSNFNQFYLSLPLSNYRYNDQKISSFYDVEFLEFIPSTTDIRSEINPISEEITQLKLQNEELLKQLDLMMSKVDENITESERLAYKQIILNLRIALRQGVSEKDFSNTFPYLPLNRK